MPLGTNHLANTASSVQEFVPELWSDDVIASYKANLVLGNLVSKINHQGKRGDTIHIPQPTRGSANAKSVGSQVTLNQDNSSEITVTIDKWFEYSIVIEDIIGIQSLPSLRRFHTDDAGYALARQIDYDLHVLGTGLQGGTLDTTPGTPDSQTLSYDAAVIGGDGSTTWDSTANTNTGNGSTLTDAGIRTMIQTLDDADVPFSQRYLVIPPVEKKTLMGLNRFTEQAFVGEVGPGNTIRNGRLGDIYGVEVFVSTACPTIKAADNLTEYRVGLMLHKDAFVLATQLSVRSQAQYKQEYLGWLYTSDTIYGTAELRDNAGVAFVVPK